MNLPSPQKTISIVGNYWFPNQPGGLDRYVYELVHSLVESELAVDLFGIGLPEHTPTDGLNVINLADPTWALPKRLDSAQKTFRRQGFSHVAAVNLHFTLYSLPLLPYLPAKVPVVFTFHGPWASESQQEGESPISVLLKQWLEQTVYRRCDRFIVLSKAFGLILHEKYRIPWEKIHIIPGGVNTAYFQTDLSRQAARERLGWPCDRKILFTPRRLVNRMGLEQLLTAMVSITTQVPEVWLAIAGKGPLQEALKQQAEELGLRDQVKFLGFLPDEQLPLAYQAADLTVVPSQSLEGFGLILLESLASGTPALCTPVGGMPEVMRPFCPDLVTESVEATAISDRLTAFLTGNLVFPTREACRDYAVTHFDWHMISQQVRRVLLDL